MNERSADYRAKRADSRERWVYGYKVGSVYNVNPHMIVDGEIDDDGHLDYEAVPFLTSTLCRNSGVTDWYNIPIYENDVVCVKNEFGEQEGPVGIVRFGAYRDNDQKDAYNLGFWIDWKSEVPDILRVELLFWTKETRLFVVGNVIDKPHLPTYLSPIKRVSPEDAIEYLTQRASSTPMEEKQNYRIAVDAIARNVAKYPTIDSKYFWVCPCCGSRKIVFYSSDDTVKGYSPFCGDCGQKIDWDAVVANGEVDAEEFDELRHHEKE